MIRAVQVTANECTCDVCAYRWLSFNSAPSLFCPNKKCRSREWNGKKQVSRAKEIAFPAPRGRGRPKTNTMPEDQP